MDIKHPVAAALALLAAGFFLGRYADSRVAPPGRIAVLTRTDTLVVEIPAPARSAAVGLRKARLPLSDAVPYSEPDSATVDIPVISAVYETADYRAVVSGFSPSLDSLTIYPRSSVVVADFSLNGQHEKRRSRWSIGLQAGYGLTPRGPQPYLGVGVTFRIL